MAVKKEIYIEADKVLSFICPKDIKGKKYYLYMHTRSDNDDVFYIGIGTNSTIPDYTRAKCRKKRSGLWKRIVNNINGYNIFIVFESNDRTEILKKEINYIKLFGKIKNKDGTLSNFTDGGDGCLGHNMSKENKIKIGKIVSESNKKRIINSSTREKLRNNRIENNKKLDYSKIRKPVYQIDPNTGIIVSKFDSISDAAISINVKFTSIGQACRKGTLCKKFIWRYVHNFDKNEIFKTVPDRKRNMKGENNPRYGKSGILSPRSKTIAKLNPLDGSIVFIYGSLREAAKLENSNHVSISKAAKENKLFLNHKWQINGN